MSKFNEKLYREGTVKMMEALGVDWYKNPNLEETPDRMVDAAREIFAGHFDKPPEVKVFPNDMHYDQMVITGPIAFYSMCEHHILPFNGNAWIGYVPRGKVADEIAGLSKFDRVVDHFARRLQTQERMTQQIADYLVKILEPVGLMIVLEAEHYCRKMRGVRQNGGVMRTSALKGRFLEFPDLKMEMLMLVNGKGK